MDWLAPETIPTRLCFSSPLLKSSRPGTVFMITWREAIFLALCLEGFFYGKISVLCALTCTLAKEVQLFPGLGFYSGIFVMYLQRSSNKSRTSIILFYALCLLYVLSVATIACDLTYIILDVSNNPICIDIIFYQFCSGVSVHYRFNSKWNHSQCSFPFILSEP